MCSSDLFFIKKNSGGYKKFTGVFFNEAEMLRRLLPPAFAIPDFPVYIKHGSQADYACGYDNKIGCAHLYKRIRNVYKQE